jgi:hypothetical protein
MAKSFNNSLAPVDPPPARDSKPLRKPSAMKPLARRRELIATGLARCYTQVENT